MESNRKRIRTLCGLDGYKKIDPPVMYVLCKGEWYIFSLWQRVTKAHKVHIKYIHSIYNKLSPDYEVVDISSYEKPF